MLDFNKKNKNNSMSEVMMKILAGILGLGIFFLPIKALFILILVICLVDLITAILRDWKKSEIKGFWKKLVLVKSRKLRRSSTKAIFYMIIIGLLFSIVEICLGFEGLGIWTAKIATLMLSINELYSIAENMGIITGNNIFVKIVKSTVMKLNEKVNIKIEDKLED